MTAYETDGMLPLGVEPEDLDGFTIEELSEYLDAGRIPPNPAIDQSPGCQLALDALERLRHITPELLSADIADEAERVDESWVQQVLAGISLDAHAGRRIPLASADEKFSLEITEGAVRGIVRAAEASVPGTLIGRCKIEGDPTLSGSPVRISIDATLAYGRPIEEIVAELRERVETQVRSHTTLNLEGVDIRVTDIRLPRAADRRSRER